MYMHLVKFSKKHIGISLCCLYKLKNLIVWQNFVITKKPKSFGYINLKENITFRFHIKYIQWGKWKFASQWNKKFGACIKRTAAKSTWTAPFPSNTARWMFLCVHNSEQRCRRVCEWRRLYRRRQHACITPCRYIIFAPYLLISYAETIKRRSE